MTFIPTTLTVLVHAVYWIFYSMYWPVKTEWCVLINTHYSLNTWCTIKIVTTHFKAQNPPLVVLSPVIWQEQVTLEKQKQVMLLITSWLVAAHCDCFSHPCPCQWAHSPLLSPSASFPPSSIPSFHPSPFPVHLPFCPLLPPPTLHFPTPLYSFPSPPSKAMPWTGKTLWLYNIVLPGEIQILNTPMQ